MHPSRLAASSQPIKVSAEAAPSAAAGVTKKSASPSRSRVSECARLRAAPFEDIDAQSHAPMTKWEWFPCVCAGSVGRPASTPANPSVASSPRSNTAGAAKLIVAPVAAKIIVAPVAVAAAVAAAAVSLVWGCGLLVILSCCCFLFMVMMMMMLALSLWATRSTCLCVVTHGAGVSPATPAKPADARQPSAVQVALFHGEWQVIASSLSPPPFPDTIIESRHIRHRTSANERSILSHESGRYVLEGVGGGGLRKTLCSCEAYGREGGNGRMGGVFHKPHIHECVYL